jgi:hypothetical protein
MKTFGWIIVLMTMIAAIPATPAFAQDDDQALEIAKKLANPIASLISVPVQ